MYEVFEHTADLGLRVRAATLDELFCEAAGGLFSLIVANLDEVQLVQEVNIRLVGQERDYLLFDWLNELLYTFETEHILLRKFECRLVPDGLEATALGEPVDRSRHELDHEVKAITYHGLKLEQQADGWLAELIVDI